MTIVTRRVIPIVAHEAWASALCARCSDPGHCCKRFALTGADGYSLRPWDHQEREEMLADMRARGMPFEPVERAHQWTAEDGPDVGRTYSSWWWTCPKLGADGRCTIYEDRPQLCRDYQPLTDRLCAMTKEKTE